jgi:hypothetical protein
LELAAAAASTAVANARVGPTLHSTAGSSNEQAQPDDITIVIRRSTEARTDINSLRTAVFAVRNYLSSQGHVVGVEEGGVDAFNIV